MSAAARVRGLTAALVTCALCACAHGAAAQQGTVTRVPAPMPPISAVQALRLRHAIDLRLGGLPERAVDSLESLQRELPHHPAVIIELARAQTAREQWPAVAELLRSERNTQRDSTLGSDELVLAYERLARPRDAAQTAVETWLASPAEAAWAMGALARLSIGDPKTPRAILRAALASHPRRGDLARGLARLEARAGDPAEAVRLLAAADDPAERPPVRQWFAEEALNGGGGNDSTAAIGALASLAADTRYLENVRIAVARRAWSASAGGSRSALALTLQSALKDVPGIRWPGDLLLDVARELRGSGRTAEARALLASVTLTGGRSPEFALESALNVLREGPPARAVPALDSLARQWLGARFSLAEARFFAGAFDSALAGYKRIADDPDAPDAAAALDRTYLIEEKPDAPELHGVALLAWQRWRGAPAQARTVADSLWRTVPRTSPYTAHVALELAELRGGANDWAGAIAPLAFVSDSLADDRLAPVARQRLGEAYLALGQPKAALSAFEECLARYPRAWNTPEVRRRVERLRRELRL